MEKNMQDKNIQDKELLRIVSGFRRGILGNKKSHLKCFMVASPLCSYLNVIGVDCVLKSGYVTMPPNTGWGPDSTFMKHYWIELPDKRILDCTADQFSKHLCKDMPKVYLGEKPTWFMPEKKKKSKTLK